MKNRKTWIMTTALLLAVMLMAGAMGRAEPAGGPAAANPAPDIYERVAPAVVQVRNIAETWSPETGASTEVALYASGVYIEEGYVLTNWHVVYEADYLEVETPDGQTVRAKNVYTDDSVDLAVLELAAPLEGVTPVPLGDSQGVRPGEPAIVIGNPVLDDIVFPATVTTGIISGVNRSSDGLGYFSRAVPLIQLDAALNIGCNGGALLNMRGELVGLVTLMAGLVDDVVYQGLGFAIPAETIRRVAGDLIEHGAVRRPRMGVMVSDLDGPEEPIRTYPPCGLLVSEIDEDGPAGKAGMEMYDIIVEFDGVRVHSFNELSAILDTHEAGDVVHVKAYRCLDEEGYMTDNPKYVEFDIELGILD